MFLELKKEIDETTIKDARNFLRLIKGIDDTKVRGVRNPFRLKKENKASKNRRIRDIRKLYEDEEHFFWVTIILNMTILMIEIKHYQLKNILIKLDHT